MAPILEMDLLGAIGVDLMPVLGFRNRKENTTHSNDQMYVPPQKIQLGLSLSNYLD